MEYQHKSHRRRKFLIDKQSQGKFILRFIAISLAGGALSVAIFITLAIRKLDLVRFSMRLPHTYASQLLMNDMLIATGLSLFITLIAFLVITGRVLKKINAPLAEITNTLKKVGIGKVRTLVPLDKTEEMEQFSREINDMILSLRCRMENIEKCSAALSGTVADYQVSGDKNNLKEKVSGHIVGFNETLGTFKC